MRPALWPLRLACFVKGEEIRKGALIGPGRDRSRFARIETGVGEKGEQGSAIVGSRAGIFQIA